MNRIAVTGGSGFIGSKFIELYANKFTRVKSLNSQDCQLGNYFKILSVTKNIDILVHAAFDHSYKDNIIGIKNILRACKENSVKKLIHISSVSVYDPNISGHLDESSPYSNFNDPYSKEKIQIEKEIERYKCKNIEVIILQPTIVYGLGGGWTKYVLHACKSPEIKLPYRGEGICNAVYVDDVAYAIYQSCVKNVEFEKLLVTGKEAITWNEFYYFQHKVLKKLKLNSNCRISCANQNEFHQKKLINIIFKVWFKTSLGILFNVMIGLLKKYRSGLYSDLSKKESLKFFLLTKVSNTIFEPVGMTKKVHECSFVVNDCKAKKKISYGSKVAFEEGINNIKLSIIEVLK